MVGRLTLDQVVGVRVPAPQPRKAAAPAAFVLSAGAANRRGGNAGGANSNGLNMIGPPLCATVAPDRPAPRPFCYVRFPRPAGEINVDGANVAPFR
jgi:hypothetical protein